MRVFVCVYVCVYIYTSVHLSHSVSVSLNPNQVSIDHILNFPSRASCEVRTNSAKCYGCDSFICKGREELGFFPLKQLFSIKNVCIYVRLKTTTFLNSISEPAA